MIDSLHIPRPLVGQDELSVVNEALAGIVGSSVRTEVRVVPECNIELAIGSGACKLDGWGYHAGYSPVTAVNMKQISTSPIEKRMLILKNGALLLLHFEDGSRHAILCLVVVRTPAEALQLISRHKSEIEEETISLLTDIVEIEYTEMPKECIDTAYDAGYETGLAMHNS